MKPFGLSFNTSRLITVRGSVQDLDIDGSGWIRHQPPDPDVDPRMTHRVSEQRDDLGGRKGARDAAGGRGCVHVVRGAVQECERGVAGVPVCAGSGGVYMYVWIRRLVWVH